MPFGAKILLLFAGKGLGYLSICGIFISSSVARVRKDIG
jgi:hypothetical protein